jgi:hypothetical protein
VLTARSAASPSAANPWAIGPICGGSRPAIEKSGTWSGTYCLALLILLPNRPPRAQRNEICGIRCQRRGFHRPGGGLRPE